MRFHTRRFWGEVAARGDNPRIAIVSEGISDVRVGRESARTLHYYGVQAREIDDVGVTGIWRLMNRIDELREMIVVITVTGIEGTLPSVVAGLVPKVVIAVPAATGYARCRKRDRIIMAVTFLFGRVFCDWICPFGTLHQFISWLFDNRANSKRIEQNR